MLKHKSSTPLRISFLAFSATFRERTHRHYPTAPPPDSGIGGGKHLTLGKDLLFVIVNFDENPAAPNVKIPAHAFEYLGIPLKESYKAKDLLTGNTETITMIPEQRTPLLLEGYGGKILKIKL